MKKKLMALIAVAAVTVMSGLLATPASASSTAMGMGSTLYQGDSIYDPGFTYRLTLQTDGNLVLYKQGRDQACWASGARGTYATYQTDGNFVLYDGSTPKWASNTNVGNPNRSWTVSINGRGVLYVGYHAVNPSGC